MNSLIRQNTRLPSLFEDLLPMRSLFDMPDILGTKLDSSLYEVENNYVLQVPIFGVKPEDVDITAHGREITIRASFERPEPEGAKVIWASAPKGTFVETFTLPNAINSEESNASYDSGILTVTMPKVERTNKITVNSNK